MGFYFMQKHSVDKDYINIVKQIHDTGTWSQDRTSVGLSKQTFGTFLKFDTLGSFEVTNDNDIITSANAPFIQHRIYSPRISFEEWKWMMSGSTDVSILQAKGIHIWDDNSTREFLNSRGLYTTPTGTIGKAYGHQFRKFDGWVDQIEQLYEGLKKDPTSRRHVVSIWNPAESSEMALLPCAHLYEFMVQDGRLNVYIHMRSSDYVFGVPYNLGFTFFWLLSFSHALGFKPGKIMLTSTNSHYYLNQVPLVEKIVEQSGYSFSIPLVSISKQLNTLSDILNLEFDDFKITNWTNGGKLVDLKIGMAV